MKSVLKPRKLPSRFTALAFSFYMSSIMAFLMSLVITAVNGGISTGYFSQVLAAYKIAMPAAFVCVFTVRPLVFALVARTVRS